MESAPVFFYLESTIYFYSVDLQYSAFWACYRFALPHFNRVIQEGDALIHFS